MWIIPLLILISSIFITFLYKYLLSLLNLNPLYLFKTKPVTTELKLLKVANDFQMVHKGSISNMYKFIKTGLILIFIDEQCPYCNPSVSRFLYEMRKYKNINFSLVINKKYASKLDELQELYGDATIFIVEEEVYELYQIHMLPSYIVIDQNYRLLLTTPLPLQAINLYNDLKVNEFVS